MSSRFLLLFTLALVTRSDAQQTPNPATGGVKGTFAAFIDDHATVFLNGNELFHGNLGTVRSPEVDLKEGDSLVIHLKNDRGPKGFLLMFESSDGKTIASFRSTDYKIVPTAGVISFTPDQFSQWTKPAKNLPGNKRDKRLDNAAKNYSETVWGDLDSCILACTMTAKQFTQRPK
jgi:hypothetical protein